MENLIVLGLAAAVLISLIAGVARTPPQPPTQFIVLQPVPPETGGTGCLPLLILVGIVLAVFVFT